MGISSKESNEWAKWSNHVLRELKRLNATIEIMERRLEDAKSEVNINVNDLLKDVEQLKNIRCNVNDINLWKSSYDTEGVFKSIKELKKWKDNMEEVVSVKQLEKYIDKIKEFDKFKTQAITIFIVIQTLVGIAISLLKFYK